MPGEACIPHVAVGTDRANCSTRASRRPAFVGDRQLAAFLRDKNGVMKVPATIAALLVGSMAAFGAAENAKDSELSREIEQRFLRDDSIVANQLDAVVTDGVATLRGQVRNLLLRDRAERIAETVPTLKAIDNRIEVLPGPGQSDQRLRNDLRMALALDPAVELPELKVSVLNGTVVLSGVVQSQLERDITVRVAKSIRGVLAVKNQILVDMKQRRPDEEIRTELQRALNRDVWLIGDNVFVKVRNGHVSLTGAVSTLAKRRRAFNRCWTAGVHSVDASMIDVWRSGELPAAKRETPKISDAEIRQEIKLAYVLNYHLLSTRVDVAVEQGVVTLSGDVRSLRAVFEAAREAYGVTGVRRVYNLLKVKPREPMTDQEVRRAIETALARDAVLDDETNIHVTVLAGATFLKGSASTAFARAHAESVVSGIPGVIRVDNQLKTVGPTPGYDPLAWDQDHYLRPHYEGIPTARGIADQELRDEIRMELRRSPFVNADQIDVAIQAGAATLTGSVPDWHQRRMAQEVARRAGVTTILNRLKVRPHTANTK